MPSSSAFARGTLGAAILGVAYWASTQALALIPGWGPGLPLGALAYVVLAAAIAGVAFTATAGWRRASSFHHMASWFLVSVAGVGAFVLALLVIPTPGPAPAFELREQLASKHFLAVAGLQVALGTFLPWVLTRQSRLGP